MIKGFQLNLVPDTKILVWEATKATEISLRTPCSDTLIGDTNITMTNGFLLISQDNITVKLANKDKLYALCCGGGSILDVFVME